MAVTMNLEAPLTADQYDEMHGQMRIEEDPPDGLIVHVCVAHGDHVHVTDVWESADHFNRFREERLDAALGAVVGEMGDGPPPEPRFEEIHNMTRP